MRTAVQFEWAVVLSAFAVIVVFAVWVVRHGEAIDSRGHDPLKPDREARPKPSAQTVPAPARPVAAPTEAPIRSRPEIVRKFHAQLLTDSSGAPISSENRPAWLQARRNGVTATDVGKIVKLNGTFSSQRSPLMEAKLTGQEGPFLQVFQHGIDREPAIAAWVAEKFGILPNSLLCRGDNPRHLATPDGIGAGVVAEIKTSTRPLDQTIGTYRDQLQWQLHVTKSERLLFVVENRNTLWKETRWVERDEYRIFILAQHADAFILEMDERRATARTPSEAPARQQAPKLALRPPEAVQIASPPRPPAHSPRTALASVTAVENNADETRPWNDAERKKLVAGYVGRATFAELAASVGTTHRAVVFELSRLWLGPEGQMVDPTVDRFGFNWSSGEEQILRDLYSAGLSLPIIARKMQRDQLGIAFRLFENYIPQLPAVRATPSAEKLGTGPALPASAVSTVAEVPKPAPGIPTKVAIQPRKSCCRPRRSSEGATLRTTQKTTATGLRGS